MTAQEQYLKALYSDFQAKVTMLAELVKDHPGEYGAVIERAIADLLRILLPSSYAIGSGFVIDSEGARSRQCDLIVYDTLGSFNAFGHGGQFLFPVESVYAVIQIKKTLDAGEVHSACENIASVKRLKSKAEPSKEWKQTEDGTIEWREYCATPPLGIIVSYQSDTQYLGTIKGWFQGAFHSTGCSSLHPDLAVSIREAFKVLYRATSHKPDSLEFKFYPLSIRDMEGNVVRSPAGEPQTIAILRSDASGAITENVGQLAGYTYNRECKKVVHPMHPEAFELADDARLLMTTLGSIANLLNIKSRRGVTAFDAYFSPYFVEAVRV